MRGIKKHAAEISKKIRRETEKMVVSIPLPDVFPFQSLSFFRVNLGEGIYRNFSRQLAAQVHVLRIIFFDFSNLQKFLTVRVGTLFDIEMHFNVKHVSKSNGNVCIASSSEGLPLAGQAKTAPSNFLAANARSALPQNGVGLCSLFLRGRNFPE